ncbi:MAG: hypothetical protein EP332_11080 [Bacteroidetes bacterium]|nr:MAG: hypothetical protein EP332_11080 [Bacteroidota bacterium]
MKRSTPLLFSGILALALIACQDNSKEVKLIERNYVVEDSSQYLAMSPTDQAKHCIAKTQEFLQDTLTDLEEFQLNFYYENIEDSAALQQLRTGLLSTESGVPLMKRLFDRMDEEAIWNSEGTLSYQSENRTSPPSFFRRFLNKPYRDSSFLESSVQLFAAEQTPLAYQSTIYLNLLIPSSDMHHYSNAELAYLKKTFEQRVGVPRTKFKMDELRKLIDKEIERRNAQ